MNLRLKRLELFGFKSFADRTSLDFVGSLTGIVGPNGCGKSNVVDAVRWVLGERSAKSLRGGEMADVIFKGSTSRPAQNVAEVTMVLDNSGGGLERGAEVSITRRVFADGEGEYLIDGDRARAKDIKNLLFDTGLGSRGYSVLEQGRIDAVLSQNAVDRRAIFEEAAGISRYRQRKKEAESRLARVQQDEARIDDVLRELTSRVRSLKIQATKAEKYVVARDEWRDARTRSARHRLAAWNEELGRVRATLAACVAEADELRRVRERSEEEAREHEEERRGLSARVDELSADVARLAGEERALDERQAQLSARIEAWKASAAEEAERAERLAGTLETRRAELEAEEAELAARSDGLAATERELAEHAERLREAKARYRDVRARSEEQNEAVLGLLHEKTAAQNKLAHLDEARAPLASRGERAEARRREAVAAFEEVEREAADAAAARERAEGAWEATEAELERTRASEVELAERARALEDEASTLSLERARAQSRCDALRDWERERESLASGARALFERLDGDDPPIPPAALAGVLADHVRTSVDYARALDVVLGDAALAIVARGRDVVAPILAWLAAEEAGEVRMVVPDGAPAIDLPAGAARLRDEPGVLARLCDEVHVDDGFRALFLRLIGDVWIARDVETALALAERYPGLRFATRKGDVVDRNGAIGGHREIAQGAIGRRSRADELDAEVRALDERLARMDTLREGLGAERERIVAERARLERESEERRGQVAELSSAERAATARLKDLSESLEHAEAEADRIRDELALLERDVAAAAQQKVELDERFRIANEALAELERERHERERERDDLTRDEGRVQVDLAQKRAELEALTRRHADLAEVCTETAAELERARRLSREAQESAEYGANEIDELQQKGRAASNERAEREVELAEQRRAEEAGRVAIEALRTGLDEVGRRLEDALARESVTKLDEQKLELAHHELCARIQDELDLSEQDLLQDFEPEEELEAEGALEALEARAVELKRTLDKIGPVNTEALAELEENQERLTFLETQRSDLIEARATLSKTLATINEESRRLFVETFEDVRSAFAVLFRQLFGGGRADLVLEADVDPLEAGIEVIARPPGREMLPIALLSGGQRTMTALALLFAVFQTRPSPFCVLDEVDAALDDANIGRFLAMLDTFRRETQFVVVTHNKGTMAACDMLYGVTMETKGVSRHVSVQFGDVDEFVPEIQGDATKASEARREAVAPAAAPEPTAVDPAAEETVPVSEDAEPAAEGVALGAVDSSVAESAAELVAASSGTNGSGANGSAAPTPAVDADAEEPNGTNGAESLDEAYELPRPVARDDAERDETRVAAGEHADDGVR